MNFTRERIQEELEPSARTPARMTSRLILHGLKILFLLAVLAAVVFGCFILGTVQGIVDTAPEPESLAVTPLGIASSIYDNAGNLKETLIRTGSNRDPVAFNRLPDDLINAFVAIEDERFWTHEGVDIRGVLRSAASLLLKGSINGGASTITQQLIKNNVFGGGAEKGWGAKFIRKFQEQYLAILMESAVSKEDILINYLNSINLGQNCLGVQVASQRYFQKDVEDLTLSECACIAGITQNPYRYNPITFPTNNSIRRKSVLNHMLDQGLITREEYMTAVMDTEELYERIAANNLKIKESASAYSYFTDAVINQVLEDLQTKLGYSESDAYTMLYSGGLNIYTTQDSSIQKVLDQEVNDPSNYPEDAFKWSFTYKVNATLADGTTHTYTESHIKRQYNLSELVYETKEEIQDLVEQFKKDTFAAGDVIADEKIYYTLQPQLSCVIIDQATGYVLAICGGRGTKSVSRSFNRATDTYRSPGSTFKVLSTFAPALDSCGQTLCSIQKDLPFFYEGYSIRNWWGSNVWLNNCTARMAIVYSMNVVSANFMLNTVGLETAFDYLESFGFTSLVREEVRNGKVYTDLGPTLCLGGLTNGVNLLELTDAFASIANRGMYNRQTFYTKITDHYGNVILENDTPSYRVLQSGTAYLLTSAMQDSMRSSRAKNTWIESSSASAALEKMPAAGKSGTSTDSSGASRDYWFVGYTNYYTMGVWSGFDNGTIPLQGNVTLNNYHKTIWKKVMDRINEGKPVQDFAVPAGITSARVCPSSGKLAIPGICDRDSHNPPYTEYFAAGTVPTEYCNVHKLVKMCADTGMVANEYCKNCYWEVYSLLETTDVFTADTNVTYIPGVDPPTCDVHKAPPPPPPTTEAETVPASTESGSGNRHTDSENATTEID